MGITLNPFTIAKNYRNLEALDKIDPLQQVMAEQYLEQERQKGKNVDWTGIPGMDIVQQRYNQKIASQSMPSVMNQSASSSKPSKQTKKEDSKQQNLFSSPSLSLSPSGPGGLEMPVKSYKDFVASQIYTKKMKAEQGIGQPPSKGEESFMNKYFGISDSPDGPKKDEDIFRVKKWAADMVKAEKIKNGELDPNIAQDYIPVDEELQTKLPEATQLLYPKFDMSNREIQIDPSTGKFAYVDPRDRLEWEREARLTKEQGLRDLRNDFNSLNTTGGRLTEDQIKRFEDNLGYSFDADNDVITGRASRQIDEDGNVSYNYLSKENYDRLISEGKFSSDEQKEIKQLAQENNAWYRVIKRLEDAGVHAIIKQQGEDQSNVPFEDREGMFEFVMDNADSGALGQSLGVLSIPARSDLVRQFMKNPALAGVSRDVELAFQKWRIRVTGVQASDKELKVLREVVAKLSDNPRVFYQTVFNFTENAKQDFDTLLDVKESFGRDTSSFRGLLERSAEDKGLGFKREGGASEPSTEQGNEPSTSTETKTKKENRIGKYTFQ